MLDQLIKSISLFSSKLDTLNDNTTIKQEFQQLQLIEKLQFFNQNQNIFYRQFKIIQDVNIRLKQQLEQQKETVQILTIRSTLYQQLIQDDFYYPIQQLKQTDQLKYITLKSQDNLPYVKKIHNLNQQIFNLKQTLTEKETTISTLTKNLQILQSANELHEKNDYTHLFNRIHLLEKQTSLFHQLFNENQTNETVQHIQTLIQQNEILQDEKNILAEELQKFNDSISTDHLAIRNENNFLKNEIYNLQDQITRNTKIYTEEKESLRERIKSLENSQIAELDPEFDIMCDKQLFNLNSNTILQFQNIDEIELFRTDELLKQQ